MTGTIDQVQETYHDHIAAGKLSSPTKVPTPEMVPTLPHGDQLKENGSDQ
jgi:hypothetical protein